MPVVELLAPYHAAHDTGTGMWHIVDRARVTVPPYTTLCNRRRLRIAASVFQTTIPDAKTCTYCLSIYRHTLADAAGLLL